MKRYRTTAVYEEESRLFYIALTLCLVVVSGYIYFLSLSVVHVVMRKEIEQDISAFNTRLGQLEARYIEKQHAMNTDTAAARGYVLATEKIFIDKSDDTLVLSRN